MKRTDHRFGGTTGVKWMRILVLFVLLIAVVFLIWKGKTGKRKSLKPLAAILFVLNENTRFSPGYSEEGFYSIKTGDGETRVTNLLGAPLQTWTNTVWTGWVYASGPIPDFASTGEIGMDVDFTRFTFDEAGRVRSVDGQLSGGRQRGMMATRESIVVGNGRNFLKLSDDRIETLKGKAFADIEALFGKPTAVRASRAVRVLRYSDSPSSRNYRKRSFGIDAKGKVVEVDDAYYWD